MSETGAGTDGVPDASILIVAVVIVGAVQRRAVQSQVRDCRVTAMVLVEPAFEVQVENVVVTLRVTVMSLEM